MGATLLAVVSRAGWLYLVALGLAMVSWAALVSGSLVGAGPPPAFKPGSARLTVEPLRTACGLRGCWAEVRLVRCTAIDPESCAPVGTLVSLSTPSELPLGGRVSLVAKLMLRPQFRNPQFAAAWPDTRPLVRAKALEAVPMELGEVSWLSRALWAARASIRSELDASLVAPHAGIARALILGEASAVANDLNTAIRDAGVSHVLAVSGMHVTVLVGGLAALLRLLWLCSPLALYWEARRVAAGVGAVLAPLVASLCGGSPSAVRAALTSTLMFALTAFGYRPQALPVSALALGLHVALEPRDSLHPGFVLSVAATAALLTASAVEGSDVWKALAESLRAWVSTAPFLILCFGGTSLVAILANVVLLPLGGLLIPLAVGHLGAAYIGLSHPLGTQAALETASGAFIGASRWCAQLDPGVRLPAPTPLQLVALSLLAAVLLLVRERRVQLVALATAAVVVTGSELAARNALPAGSLQVVFLDVGQGDGALVQTAEGITMLIDAGGSMEGGPDPGAASVLPVLGALRITRIDVMVMSHPHPDHYGGLQAVLHALPVGELWDTGQAEGEGTQGAQRIVELARSLKVRVRRPRELCGVPQALASAFIEVLAPCPAFDEAYGANDNSFVLRLTHGRHSVLFTGDVEAPAETRLAHERSAALRSDVLKVAHHGSRTSSTAPFLAAVHPVLAVISAGRANGFGHPHAEVEARLQGHVKHVLRTDRVGGVRVVSDG
ncbi:MAG TPA: DNA internalization-related competence protein ComEC/Rec2, partial [Polyangiales bacterium]